MIQGLRRRVERIERERHAGGDWRQFGNNPRHMPDWALVAAMLWNLDQAPELRGRAELSEAHRLYDAGDVDAVYEAFQPLLSELLRRPADCLAP